MMCDFLNYIVNMLDIMTLDLIYVSVLALGVETVAR